MKEISCALRDSAFRHFEEARLHSVTSLSSTCRCVAVKCRCVMLLAVVLIDRTETQRGERTSTYYGIWNRAFGDATSYWEHAHCFPPRHALLGLVAWKSQETITIKIKRVNLSKIITWHAVLLQSLRVAAIWTDTSVKRKPRHLSQNWVRIHLIHYNKVRTPACNRYRQTG